MPITDATSTMALKSVSCYTKTAGLSVVTDLTGTTWVLNNRVYLNLNQDFNISSNHLGYNFSTLRLFMRVDVEEGKIWRALYLDDYAVLPQDTDFSRENYDTDPIEFTGGTDATNTDLINWLYTNATLIAPTISLKPVRYFIKKTGSSITDLTGTTWLLNDYLSPWTQQYETFNLDIASNNQNFNVLKLWEYGNGAQLTLQNTVIGTSVMPYDAQSGSGWSNQAYKTITITGGEDVTNSSAITSISNNAVLVSGLTYLQPVLLLRKVEEEVIEAPTLITFTITPTNQSPVECQAEEGMTWYEWTNSEYNTAVFTFLGVDYSLTCASEISTVSNGAIGYGAHTLYDNTSSNEIYGANIIIANYNYNLVHTGGGSNN